MTMHAYDQTLLHKACTTLGWMFHYGVNVYNVELDEFFRRFVNSGIAEKYGYGAPSVVAGRSGAELAFEAVSFAEPEIEMLHMNSGIDRTPEYWLGYSLAHYQWEKNISFSIIGKSIPMSKLILMYPKYHEMDIRQFVDQVDVIMKESNEESMLKRLRKYALLSQRDLAEKSGVPVRTIQQYEQGQKDISRANAEYVVNLSKALHCRPEDFI